MQLSIENVDQAGGCTYGYSCVYTDTISWASPEHPLPMVRDPRVVFDQLFGVGATPEARAANRRSDRSILDWVTLQVTQMRKQLGTADKARLSDYLDNVREIERRIQQVEARNASGEQRELPDAPMGVPDSFEEHVKLMMDLQVLAFQADVTRVFSFKLSRDASGRSFPESGISTGFHNASHHGEKEEKIVEFAKINRYHVSLLPYLLAKLKATPDGDGNLLDNSLIIYGSPMADSNIHNHKRAPLLLAGHAGGKLKGGMHIKAPDGTPMANADADHAAHARSRRCGNVRRQHGSARPEQPVGCSDDGRRCEGLTTMRRTFTKATCSLGLLAGLAALPVLIHAAGAATPAAIVEAAQSGNRDALRAALKDGADVNAAQGDGMTPLHWAAVRNDVEMADLLMYAGANVKATTRIGGYTPLLVAAKTGNAKVIETLIKHGADPDRTTANGTTPLMLAAAAGDADAVRILAYYSANVNAREKVKGETALDFAAASGRTEAIRVLTAAGADPKLATNEVNLAAFAKEEQEQLLAQRGGGNNGGARSRRRRAGRPRRCAGDAADSWRQPSVQLHGAGRLLGRPVAAAHRGAPGSHRVGQGAARSGRRRQPAQPRRPHHASRHRDHQRPLRSREDAARSGRRSERLREQRRGSALRGAERAVGGQGPLSAAARLRTAAALVSGVHEGAARQRRRSERPADAQGVVLAVRLRSVRR